jgi:pimeloyl-ACP methyl ester carboxylesterase
MAVLVCLAGMGTARAHDFHEHDPFGLRSSAVPDYPDVVGEFMQIPGARSAGTPQAFDSAAFLRVRSGLDGLEPRDADAVIIAMPGFSSIPSHWLFLAAQLVHKGNQRTCSDERRGHRCSVEVWIVERRGSNLEDTFGLWLARVLQNPFVGVDYYFGQSIIGSDPALPNKFPTTPAQFLVGRPDAIFRPLEQADVPFVAEWGFETYAGDVDRMIDLIRERHAGKNIFLAGHSQGGGFVSAYAGRLRPDGKRGNDVLTGLIFLDGGPSAGTTAAPSADQLQTYFAGVDAYRTGAAPVFTNGTGSLPNYNGPGPGARTSLGGLFYELKGPNAEAIFQARQTESLATHAGDAFLRKLRITNLTSVGMGIDTDPLPGRFLQNPTIVLLGEGLGQLDFTPLPGTENLCDPLSLPSRCMPHPDQVDPNRVYGWIEAGGNGSVAEVGKARLYGLSLGYSPTRTNVRPIVHTFPQTGTHVIFAGAMNPSNFYPSNRYDSDMSFLGTFRTIDIQEHGISIEFDKGVIDKPVFVARQATASVNPFPLVTDFSEINRSGVTQTPSAKSLTPFDPAINTLLFKHTDFVSADDSTPEKTPGQPGSSAISHPLIDWILARRAGTATVPSPRSLGVIRIR